MNGAHPMTAIEHLKAKPIAGSVVAGLLASLCCGGSLIFASIGLGVFYSTLGLSRFIPQALAAGALSIVAINYLYYRQMVKKGSGGPVALQQEMFISTAIGLAVMAASFVFMEWLNHAVVHGDRFLARAEYSQAFIKGVPNITLLYQFAEKLEIGRAMRNIRIQSLMVANLSCVAQTGLESMLPIGTPRKPFSANCYAAECRPRQLQGYSQGR